MAWCLLVFRVERLRLLHWGGAQFAPVEAVNGKNRAVEPYLLRGGNDSQTSLLFSSQRSRPSRIPHNEGVRVGGNYVVSVAFRGVGKEYHVEQTTSRKVIRAVVEDRSRSGANRAEHSI